MDPKDTQNTGHVSAILVVDPDERIYRTFGKVLGSRYHLVFAPNDALIPNFLNNMFFALVFVGQLARGDHGLSLIRSLTADHPAIPVIFIAKSTTPNLILSSFRAGAKDIITAPIDPEELLEMTERVILQTAKSPKAESARQPISLFNLKNLWMQLRSDNHGYVKITAPDAHGNCALKRKISIEYALPSDGSSSMLSKVMKGGRS